MVKIQIELSKYYMIQEIQNIKQKFHMLALIFHAYKSLFFFFYRKLGDEKSPLSGQLFNVH